MTRQGVTKHIKTLEEAGLVTIDAQGRERFCNANSKPLKEINKWLQFYSQFWDDSLKIWVIIWIPNQAESPLSSTFCIKFLKTFYFVRIPYYICIAIVL